MNWKQLGMDTLVVVVGVLVAFKVKELMDRAKVSAPPTK